MTTPHENPLHDLWTDADIAALAWTVAIFRQKLIPFFLDHADHHPSFCFYANPEFLATSTNIVEHLETMVDGYNAQRVEDGKPPVVTFADAGLRDDGGYHA